MMMMMMTTMNLHPLVIKIDLGRIKAERILVSAMVKLLAKRRIFFICVSMYKIIFLV
jgi:hypothetical protein